MNNAEATNRFIAIFHKTPADNFHQPEAEILHSGPDMHQMDENSVFVKGIERWDSSRRTL